MAGNDIDIFLLNFIGNYPMMNLIRDQTIQFLDGVEDFDARQWLNLHQLCEKTIPQIDQLTAMVLIPNFKFEEIFPIGQAVAAPWNHNSKNQLIEFLQGVNMVYKRWAILAYFCLRAVPLIRELKPNEQLDCDIIADKGESPPTSDESTTSSSTLASTRSNFSNASCVEAFIHLRNEKRKAEELQSKNQILGFLAALARNEHEN